MLDTPWKNFLDPRMMLTYGTNEKVSKGGLVDVGMRVITFGECSSSVTHTTNRSLNSIIQMMRWNHSELKECQLPNSVYDYGHQLTPQFGIIRITESFIYP